MKKLLIMCGTGVATSTVVTGKVKEWLKSKGNWLWISNSLLCFSSLQYGKRSSD